MVEAEGIPPTASVASVGPGIRYLGNWAYALSGQVACSNVQTTLLLFHTGTGIIRAQLDFGTGSVSSRDMKWQVFLNDIEVYAYVSSGTNQAGANPQNTLQIILPPLTKVEVTSENETDSNTENQYCVLSGRVYDV